MRKFNMALYSDDVWLVSLINYYEMQCIDAMYERINLEIKKRR